MSMESSRAWRRSHQEIVADILEACRRPELKTRIMYWANLKWISLNRELVVLQERGLVETVGARYVLTEKGVRLRRQLREVLELTRRGSR